MRFFAIVAMIAGLNLGITSISAGQQRVSLPGRFEVTGFDFAPDGAWRRRVKQIRQTREAMLRAGALSTLNAPGLSSARVSGNVNIPVILVQFPNASGPFPVSDYQDVLFSSAPTLGPYSLRSYYEQVSDNNLVLTGTVVNWVTAAQTDAYYADGCRGIGVDQFGRPILCGHPLSNQPGSVSARFRDLLNEMLAAVDNGTFNWGAFDNDGPDQVPNSPDDDGFVDFVTFIHAGVDGACGSPFIWSHRFTIGNLNGGTNYTTKTPRSGGGFIRVRDYTIQSAQGGKDGCTGGQLMAIGTLAHETGHAFGLPDLYDTQGGSEGVGEWGIMGSGNYTLAYSPARYDAWSLAQLGWVTVDTLTASGTTTINPVQTSDTVYYVPLTGTDEYLLLENRDSLESDTTQMNAGFGSRRKSPGLLIWHLDQSIITSGLVSNTVNAGPIHGVALEQADGLNQLRLTSGANRGDVGDPYPGSTVNRSWTLNTNPGSKNNAGTYAGFVIDSIYRNASGAPGVPSPIVLRFVKRLQSVFTTNRTGANIRVNAVTTQRFDDVVTQGDNITLEAISPQTITAGRTQLTFASWSDGGAQIHSVVSGATPDTVVASFTASHKVNLVTAPSGGTVASDIAGSPNLVTGTFVAEGTPVTLTATPTVGGTFIRFQGDTTTTNATLVLPMGRPYSLTALFSGSVTIVTADAVNALLGGTCPTTPCMSAQQLTYMDQSGNNDGVYNLGDFLAYADRTGLNPASGEMQRLLSQPTISVPLGAPTTPKER